METMDKSDEGKLLILNNDMNEEMKSFAIDCATNAMQAFHTLSTQNVEKEISAFIKQEFDKKYYPNWHCIVGRHFGTCVSHEVRHSIYFYLGEISVLLYKCG